MSFLKDTETPFRKYTIEKHTLEDYFSVVEISGLDSKECDFEKFKNNILNDKIPFYIVKGEKVDGKRTFEINYKYKINDEYMNAAVSCSYLDEDPKGHFLMKFYHETDSRKDKGWEIIDHILKNLIGIEDGYKELTDV